MLLHHLLRDAATTRPDGVAVADGDRSISYGELDRWASQVAHTLADAGVRRGDRVALYADKSLEAVAGLYGILKAGAAYVPLNPQAPVGRLAGIMGDAGAAALVSTHAKGGWADLLSGGSAPRAIVALDEPTGEYPGMPGVAILGADAVAAAATTEPPSPVIGMDLAYLLYTSGSTGIPKGVMLTHDNALAFVSWAVRTFGIRSDDRLSSHAPFHFDLSVFDLYASSMAAATLVLVPPDLSGFPIEITRFVARHELTTWYSVPSILTMLALRGGLAEHPLPSLRTVIFAGEVFPTGYLRQLMDLLPSASFANLYGPTETNVCTWYPVPRDLSGDDPIPIGRAISGDEVFAVTDDGRLAEPGETGELMVRGATVMQGYWGDHERTMRTLVPHPFRPELRDPVYRTGDLVRLEPNGDYAFIGRRDSQIKSRGYRIELGDVETAIFSHPGVVECAVVAIPDDLVTNRLVGFVALRDGVTVADVLRHCRTRLPRYMVPETLEIHDELPKTSTGKVDRRTLTTSHVGVRTR